MFACLNNMTMSIVLPCPAFVFKDSVFTGGSGTFTRRAIAEAVQYLCKYEAALTHEPSVSLTDLSVAASATFIKHCAHLSIYCSLVKVVIVHQSFVHFLRDLFASRNGHTFRFRRKIICFYLLESFGQAHKSRILYSNVSQLDQEDFIF